MYVGTDGKLERIADELHNLLEEVIRLNNTIARAIGDKWEPYSYKDNNEH